MAPSTRTPAFTVAEPKAQTIYYNGSRTFTNRFMIEFDV